MLDSLVRVARGVGQVTDRFATDAEYDVGTPARCTTAVRGHWRQSPQVGRPHRDEARSRPRKVFLGPPTGQRNPSRGYGSILPTSLTYVILPARGFSPWGPDAVMSTDGWEDSQPAEERAVKPSPLLTGATSPRFSRTGGGAPDAPKTGALCQPFNPISERVDSRVVNAYARSPLHSFPREEKKTKE